MSACKRVTSLGNTSSPIAVASIRLGLVSVETLLLSERRAAMVES